MLKMERIFNVLILCKLGYLYTHDLVKDINIKKFILYEIKSIPSVSRVFFAIKFICFLSTYPLHHFRGLVNEFSDIYQQAVARNN
jgi:hypothetical protein